MKKLGIKRTHIPKFKNNVQIGTNYSLSLEILHNELES